MKPPKDDQRSLKERGGRLGSRQGRSLKERGGVDLPAEFQIPHTSDHGVEPGGGVSVGIGAGLVVVGITATACSTQVPTPMPINNPTPTPSPTLLAPLVTAPQSAVSTSYEFSAFGITIKATDLNISGTTLASIVPAIVFVATIPFIYREVLRLKRHKRTDDAVKEMETLNTLIDEMEGVVLKNNSVIRERSKPMLVYVDEKREIVEYNWFSEKSQEVYAMIRRLQDQYSGCIDKDLDEAFQTLYVTITSEPVQFDKLLQTLRQIRGICNGMNLSAKSTSLINRLIDDVLAHPFGPRD